MVDTPRILSGAKAMIHWPSIAASPPETAAAKSSTINLIVTLATPDKQRRNILDHLVMGVQLFHWCVTRTHYTFHTNLRGVTAQ